MLNIKYHGKLPLANVIVRRILETPESLIVSFKRLTLLSLSSQAMFPFPLMRAARWTVLLPGDEHASRTFA